MRFENVCIESIGYHLPENVVRSDDLERRLQPLYDRFKLNVGRLELMSGIRERRFWNKGEFPSAVASKAGEDALARTPLDRKEIGALICGSVSRDFLEPATASVVHNNLKLNPDSIFYDVSNACLGVLNGMVQVANMIEHGQIRAGLIVSGENGGPLVDHTIETLLADPNPTRHKIKTAFASLTIGSAAVAVLLVHKDLASTRHRLIGGAYRSATQFNHLCQGNQDSGMGGDAAPLMQTDSETLMQEGCELARETWEVFKSNLGWTNDSVDRIFCHQVGHLHRKLLYETLELDLAKDFSTLEFLGNTGSAALPVTLALGNEVNVIQHGQKVGLLGIGSGLSCVMLGAEW
ncbi:3-oxoacyl-ACP synthase III [Nitrospina gracilis]|uniref:3-oxoacyl-ACP synthase III n=1 Tax=Nitrospina gracilis TaxID=35801 RepID=UPI001F001906|nr:3-oxoacyl-ACP synthase III [Nitrospina gracilis]MCF8720742.1 3-oxoacyl-[acyl-carrier-protein] synthase-3 [Nitrospina gracilis Nb-211]